MTTKLNPLNPLLLAMLAQAGIATPVLDAALAAADAENHQHRLLAAYDEAMPFRDVTDEERQ